MKIAPQRLKIYQSIHVSCNPKEYFDVESFRSEAEIKKYLLDKAIEAEDYNALTLLCIHLKCTPTVKQFHDLCHKIAKDKFLPEEAFFLIFFTTTSELAQSVYEGKTVLHAFASHLILSINKENHERHAESRSKFTGYQKVIQHLIKLGAPKDELDPVYNVSIIESAMSETSRRLFASKRNRAYKWEPHSIKIALINNAEDEKADFDKSFADTLFEVFLLLRKEKKIASNIEFVRLAASDVDKLNQAFDAVIMPGNSRNYPSDYFNLEAWQQSDECNFVDKQFIKAFQFAQEKHIPYLGICAGKQMITLHHEGYLEHVSGHDFLEHDIYIEKGSLLHRAILSEAEFQKFQEKQVNINTNPLKLNVFSNHSYSTVIDTLEESIQVLATEVKDDDHAEAICTQDELMLGLQFHPEDDLIEQDKNPKTLTQLENIYCHFAKQAEIYHYQKLAYIQQNKLAKNTKALLKTEATHAEAFRKKQLLNQEFKSIINGITLAPIKAPPHKNPNKKPWIGKFWKSWELDHSIQDKAKPVSPYFKESEVELNTAERLLFFRIRRNQLAGEIKEPDPFRLKVARDV